MYCLMALGSDTSVDNDMTPEIKTAASTIVLCCVMRVGRRTGPQGEHRTGVRSMRSDTSTRNTGNVARLHKCCLSILMGHRPTRNKTFCTPNLLYTSRSPHMNTTLPHFHHALSDWIMYVLAGLQVV